MCVASAGRAVDIPAGIVSTLNAEKKYLSAMKQWESYETRKAERNVARAELESRHGYDTKHAMHLVRLMRMGLEIDYARVDRLMFELVGDVSE